MTNDDLAKGIDSVVERIDAVVERIDAVVARMEQGFKDSEVRDEELRRTMEQGFNDSKTRDEELRGLTTFGLEAREILRDEMLRQFEIADQKHDQQITLLKDAVHFWRSPR